MLKQTEDRFVSNIEDQEIFDSLDAAKKLFMKLPMSIPTLEQALTEAGLNDVDTILQNSKEFAGIAMEQPEIRALNLTEDEAAAISCYTVQGSKDDKSPYEIINGGIANNRSKNSLFTTRKLIFLFLSGLRKLNRYNIEFGKQLYRGLKVKVPLTEGEANGHQYYVTGRTITWWGFTSTSININVINKFINDCPASTLFSISGIGMWGYDIQPFSPYEEKEILLEPEAKVKAIGSVTLSSSVVVNVELQPYTHLVLEGILPPKLPTIVIPGPSSDPNSTTTPASSAQQTQPILINLNPSAAINPFVNAAPPSGSNEPRKVPENFHLVSKAASNNTAKPGLPDGWEARYDAKSGRYYYADTVDKVTTWMEPPCNSKVPSGKRVAYDKEKKCFYFKDLPPPSFSEHNTNDVVEYPKDFKWENETSRSVELTWSPVKISNRVISYQVLMRDFKVSKDNAFVVYEGMNNRCVINGLMPKNEYEFLVCYMKDGMCGKYTPPIKVTTKEVYIVKKLSVTLYARFYVEFTWVPFALSNVNYKIKMINLGSSEQKIISSRSTSNVLIRDLKPESRYLFQIKPESGCLNYDWSNPFVVNTPKKWNYVWKEHANNTITKKYVIDSTRPSIATCVSDGCTVIGEKLLPNLITTWNIKIMKSRNNDGYGFYIGVAPYYIDQDASSNYNKCGWYLNCYNSTLRSGPPHNYWWRDYGPRGKNGQYVRSGDTIGVIMDTTKRTLSFVLNDTGIAYTDIPIERPLVPCVIIKYDEDSVEIVP